jgi:hypothetical protein
LDGETIAMKVRVDEIVEYLLEMKNKMAELPMLSNDPVCLSQKACGSYKKHTAVEFSKNLYTQ